MFGRALCVCLCDKIYVLVTKMDGITWSETRFSAVAFGEERRKTPHSLHHVLPNARSHKHIKYLSMSKDGSGFGSSHCEHIERFGVGVMGTQPPSHSSCDALHSQHECKGMCERFLCMCVHGFNPSSYFMNTKAVATRNYTPPNTHSRHHISANIRALNQSIRHRHPQTSFFALFRYIFAPIKGAFVTPRTQRLCVSFLLLLLRVRLLFSHAHSHPHTFIL